jgi:hypothetical protein
MVTQEFREYSILFQEKKPIPLRTGVSNKILKKGKIDVAFTVVSESL